MLLMTLTKPCAKLTKPSPSLPPFRTTEVLTVTGFANTPESAVCWTATRWRGEKILKGESRAETSNAVNAKPQRDSRSSCFAGSAPLQIASAAMCCTLRNLARHPRCVWQIFLAAMLRAFSRGHIVIFDAKAQRKQRPQRSDPTSSFFAPLPPSRLCVKNERTLRWQAAFGVAKRWFPESLATHPR
jgi:hypothetical protein